LKIQKLYFYQSPPIYIWIILLVLSLSGLFFIGLSPDAINTNLPYYLLVFNILVSLIALIFLFFSLKKLKRNQSKNILGSRFTWSLIKIVPLLVLAPVLSFYLFSFKHVQSLQGSMDQTVQIFNQDVIKQVEQVQTETLNTVQRIYQSVTSENFKQLENFSNFTQNDESYTVGIQSAIDRLVLETSACHLGFYKVSKLIAETVRTKTCFPDSVNLDNLGTDQPLATYIYPVEKKVDSDFLLHTIIDPRYFNRTQSKDYIALSAVYKVDKSLISLLEKLTQFKLRGGIRQEITSPTLRKKFLADFSTSIVFTLLATLMMVFRMVNKLMLPLENLSRATREIAKGNYDVQVKVEKADEDLQQLVTYFNEMSRQIKNSREGLDTHNLYLENILKYSYGVIALDRNKRIQFINPISIEMLSLTNSEYYFGKSYKELSKDSKTLTPLTEVIDEKYRSKEWSAELKLSFQRSNKLISCQGARLFSNNKILGHVIILNDITELTRAQKKAAWGEVALKMAHEVKNPLTPILLSADRLRNRLLEKLTGQDKEIVDKTTITIIDQVKSMAKMVEAFSDFANTPKIDKTKNNLNLIINSVVALYDADELINININLSRDIPDFFLDLEGIKRVFINLIKNSSEAKAPNSVSINIKSELIKSKKMVKIIIEDDGPGFNEEIIDSIFEPYVTTKMTGTGLGLTIVQSIIEQHNGSIAVSNIKTGGSRFIIELPLG